MRTQEEVFRAYYSAMTDGDLLKTAANRSSFIDIAQKFLAEELLKRGLEIPLDAPPKPAQTVHPPRRFGWFARILQSRKAK